MNIKDRLDTLSKSSGFHVSCVVDSVHMRDGKILSQERQNNIVVNGGLNYIVENITSTANPAYKTDYIGLGISAVTPAATDTDLAGASYEGALTGLARATGAISIGAGSIGMFQVSKTFTSSIANASVGAAGLYTRSSGGYLFAGVTLSSPPVLQAADTLTITWTVAFS